MKSSWEFQPMVDKGCKLLDERLGPEWVEKIDLQTLALESDCSCVLGQLSIDLGGELPSYGDGAVELFNLRRYEASADELAAEHGFILEEDGNPREYEPLTECWRQTILSRRAES